MVATDRFEPQSVGETTARPPRRQCGSPNYRDGMLTELAAAVRRGQVSPRELVEESLRRIDKHNADAERRGRRSAPTRPWPRPTRSSADADRGPVRRGSGARQGPRRMSPGMRTTFGSPLVRRRAAGPQGQHGHGATSRRRRDRRRQDEHARVRLDGLHRQPSVRRDAQPLEHGSVTRRVERRFRCRRWRPASRRSRPRPTAADRCGSPRRSAGWSATSRRWA